MCKVFICCVCFLAPPASAKRPWQQLFVGFCLACFFLAAQRRAANFALEGNLCVVLFCEHHAYVTHVYVKLVVEFTQRCLSQSCAGFFYAVNYTALDYFL